MEQILKPSQIELKTLHFPEHALVAGKRFVIHVLVFGTAIRDFFSQIYMCSILRQFFQHDQANFIMLEILLFFIS